MLPDRRADTKQQRKKKQKRSSQGSDSSMEIPKKKTSLERRDEGNGKRNKHLPRACYMLFWVLRLQQ